MKTETLKSTVAQGATDEKKAENARRIQISILQLETMAKNEELLEAFVVTLKMNPEMNAPIAYQFAEATVKQLKIPLK